MPASPWCYLLVVLDVSPRAYWISHIPPLDFTPSIAQGAQAPKDGTSDGPPCAYSAQSLPAVGPPFSSASFSASYRSISSTQVCSPCFWRPGRPGKLNSCGWAEAESKAPRGGVILKSTERRLRSLLLTVTEKGHTRNHKLGHTKWPPIFLSSFYHFSSLCLLIFLRKRHFHWQLLGQLWDNIFLRRVRGF